MIALDEVGIVALGSNLRGEYGSSLELLTAAVAQIPSVGFEVRRVSSLWRSPAWPDPNDPEYLNAIALVETRLIPARALDALMAVEARFGRRRAQAHAPRTLDLDLIALGRRVISRGKGGLILPHPRAHERRFVMGPLAEIAPDWVHPILGGTAMELARSAKIGETARPEPLGATLPKALPTSK